MPSTRLPRINASQEALGKRASVDIQFDKTAIRGSGRGVSSYQTSITIRSRARAHDGGYRQTCQTLEGMTATRPEKGEGNEKPFMCNTPRDTEGSRNPGEGRQTMQSASLLERGLNEPQCDHSRRDLTLEFRCFFSSFSLPLNLSPLICPKRATEAPASP